MSSLARQTHLPRNLEAWLLAEIGRARDRLVELRQAHPAAADADLAQRLIDGKKREAARAGAVTGLFGLAAIPADVAMVGYLQVTLAIELAVLYGVNLKAPAGRRQLFDLAGWEHGAGSLALLVPALAARAGQAMLRRSAWKLVGRTVPLFAAPLAAWVNTRELQRWGDAAVLCFGACRRPRTPAPPPTDVGPTGDPWIAPN
jgi:hypothetical protein